MKLTRHEKDGIITVLEKAKPFVTKGYTVCNSVVASCNCLENSYLARYYIMSLIPQSDYVTNWLYNIHGIKLNKDQAREYRLAWVDHMIKELRK